VWAFKGKVAVHVSDLNQTESDRRPARIRSWRNARIQRFRDCQRYDRHWINFEEIADWCARENGSIWPDTHKQTVTYDTLERDLLSGEFNEGGRSQVLYLHPSTKRARMTREWLADAIHHNYDGSRGRSEFLPYCWMSRKSFNRWLAKNRLPADPERFRLLKRPPAKPGIAAEESAAIKALTGYLKARPQVSRTQAQIWCQEGGFRFSERGFKQRVWPEARMGAGLPRLALAGRKSKSVR